MKSIEQKARTLFVTPVSPFSHGSGAEQRSSLMLIALQALGPVDVLELRHDNVTRVNAEDKNGMRHVIAQVQGANLALSRYAPKPSLTRGIEQALGTAMGDYRLIVGRYVWPICQLAIPANVPVIVDLDDFKFRYAQEASWSLAMLKERLAKALAHIWVRRQLKRFSGAFLVSAQDRSEVSGLPNILLSNVPATQVEHPAPVPSSKNILFVGSLWYRPNTDGVNWFLKHVWPQVLMLEPLATLTLAGGATAPVRAQWETHPQVSAPGFVEDLAAAYRHANLVVVPLHAGGGTNIKVLEAMAHGRPCLVSSFVAAAFEGVLTDTRELLVARTPGEFVGKIIHAFTEPASTQPLAHAGHLTALQHFTPAIFQARVLAFAQSVCNPAVTAGDRL